MQDNYTKHRETIFITILVILLIAIFLISKFAFGINLGLLENTYQSVGYEEIREDGLWALSFGTFNGQVQNSIPVLIGTPLRLLVKNGGESGTQNLNIKCGSFERSFLLDGKMLEIDVPTESGEVELLLKGQDVIYGYFSIIWD